MSGAISSLGIGSGVLTSDIIDQLKAADTSRIIQPIEYKVTINNQEQDAQKLLTSLMKTFKSSASALSYDTIFDDKTVSSSGTAEVTVSAGAAVESFSLTTNVLAKKEISSFAEIGSTLSPIASGAGTISIAGFDVPYDATTTLESLAQAITDVAGSKASASVLETSAGNFTLMVSSNETGLSEALNIVDTTGLLDATLFDAANGFQLEIQAAVDAQFDYNGISVTRSTNEISDLIIGVDITLKTEGDVSAVTIEQDTSTLTGELEQFKNSYNTLMQNISDMINVNDETGAQGIFNGESFIKGIQSDINSVITAMNSSNDSLVNYGIDIDKYGTMSFDETTFTDKLKADPDGVKVLFSGGIDANGNDVTGWFVNIDDKLNSYTGYGKLLSNFESELTSNGDRLSDSYIKATESLNSRYEIMTQRFIAYDAIISRINAQFSSMQMMITSQVNGN